MSPRDFLFLILGMGAVTYLPRVLPLITLSRNRLPSWFAEWLELIPPAILAALLAPELLADNASRTLAFGKTELLAALPTLLVALKTRSLAGTVLVGMACYWGIQQIR